MPTTGPRRALVTAQLVSAVGDGAYYTTSALYFTHVVGLSPFRLGLGLAVGWTVGTLTGVPLGHLADRRGPRGTAVLFALAAAAVVGTFLVVRSFVPFLFAVSLYAAATSGLGSASQALVGALVSPAERTGLLARLQSTLNGGLAVGALLGGVAIHSGSRTAFLLAFALDALSFVAAAVVLRRLPAVPPAPAATTAGEPRLAVLHDRPYAVVALINTVLLLRMPLLSLAVPLWIAARAPGLDWLSSALFALNTLAVLLFQVRTAGAVTGLGSASRAVRRAGLLLLVSCAVFAGSAARLPLWMTGALLVAAAGLQVVGEMHQSAGSWQISFDLAPAHRLGQYQGFFGSGVAVARTLGPLVLTTLLLTWGVPGWLLLGGIFAAAGCAMGPAVRRAERSRLRAQTAVAAPQAPIAARAAGGA